MDSYRPTCHSARKNTSRRCSVFCRSLPPAQRQLYAASPSSLSYLPFSVSGGALLFHLLSKLYQRTSVVISTSLRFSEWSSLFGDAKLTMASLGQADASLPRTLPQEWR